MIFPLGITTLVILPMAKHIVNSIMLGNSVLLVFQVLRSEVISPKTSWRDSYMNLLERPIMIPKPGRQCRLITEYSILKGRVTYE